MVFKNLCILVLLDESNLSIGSVNEDATNIYLLPFCKRISNSSIIVNSTMVAGDYVYSINGCSRHVKR